MTDDHSETETGSYEFGDLELHWQAELSFEKGEDRIMYLPDESGYPGSPDTWSLVEIVCQSLEHERDGHILKLRRRAMPPLVRAMADQLVLQAFRDDDQYEEVICYE